MAERWFQVGPHKFNPALVCGVEKNTVETIVHLAGGQDIRLNPKLGEELWGMIAGREAGMVYTDAVLARSKARLKR